MRQQKEQIWVDGSFYNWCQPKIIRDKKLRRQVKRLNPDAEVFSSFADVTRMLYERYLKD
jgi:hypothetical protein